MIFHKSILLAVIVSAVAVSAINKKSDENGSQTGNQPVYSGPGGNGAYSVPNQYNPGNGQEHGGQGNLQQGSPQSNLYYYYYPVQDKQKEAQYHNGNQQMNHPAAPSSHDATEHGPMEAAASGSEMSYSSSDLAQDYSNAQNQGFDPQALSNLASQLQMNFNGAQNYDANNAALSGFGQAESSNHMPQVHPNFNGPMGGPQGPMGFAPQGPYPGQQYFQPNNQVQSQTSEITSSITSGLKKYGLTSILMPVLALAGLSLLLPTVTSLGTTTTKTKRSIEENTPISAYIEKVDNYYKMYNKAMEKEECMNRMICELGDAVSGVRGRSALLMVVENLAPQWMEKKMAVFKNGALGKESAKCKKYAC